MTESRNDDSGVNILVIKIIVHSIAKQVTMLNIAELLDNHGRYIVE